jgi:hypothetical protein
MSQYVMTMMMSTIQTQILMENADDRDLAHGLDRVRVQTRRVTMTH